MFLSIAKKPLGFTATILSFVLFTAFSGEVLAQGQVDSLTLVDANSNLDIVGLADGDTINLPALPSPSLNVRANASGSVGSVVFGLDSDPSFRTEGVAPYALAGDVSGNYNDFGFSIGQHTITATPYSGSGGSGTPGTPLVVTFSVVNASLSLSPVSHDFGSVALGGTDSFTFTLRNNDLGSGNGIFQEQGGVVAFEFESQAAVPDWTEKTDIPGFTGSSYYQWTGSDFFSTPGNGVITFRFEIV